MPTDLTVRETVRRIVHHFGFEVRKISNLRANERAARLRQETDKWRLVQRYQPRTILDIGANEGQFARLIRQVVPDARIICFEPLADCLAVLRQTAEELAPLEIMPYGLGDAPGSFEIHHNAFSPSSSLLEMCDRHREELPHTADVTRETVEVQRLDDVTESLQLEEPFFVKIDVQGFTSQVLRGGEATLRRASAIVAEISTTPLYHGEGTFEEIHTQLVSFGFAYRGNIDQWVSDRDGQILQCDCLFENVRLRENVPAGGEMNGSNNGRA